MPHVILVAEDYPALQALFTTLFTAEGYTVDVVADGFTLVERAACAPLPDLIITDVDMRRMTGIVAARFLRANPLTAHVPIVVQSADPRYAAAAYDAGATVFFTKPVDLDELLTTVQRLLAEERHVNA